MNAVQLATNYNPYIPWDVTLFYSGMTHLRGVIGTAFNIGIWIFVIISGIYLVIKLVSSFGQ